MWSETYRGTVYPWHCDHMGHMNVMWYVGKFDEATWNFFAGLGMSAAWLQSSGGGLVAAEQRLAYLSELLPGDTLVVRSAVLEVRNKTIRFVHHMHEGTSNRLAAVCQLIGVHIDAQARKSRPLPATFLDQARARVTSVELPWDAAA